MSFLGLPDEAVDINVVNDGFYPDISVGYLQEYYRVPSEFESGMVKNQLQLSMIWANEQLVDWQIDQVEAGYLTLADIPAAKIGGDTTKELQYRHAVCCHAKASLFPEYDSMVKAKSSRNEADETENQADIFFNKAGVALASLQGKSSIMVEAL